MADDGDDAHRELRRVVDRLRSMPLTRLGLHAVAARVLAQDLADRGADLAGHQRYVVPDVGDAAVGDQVAVTGRDLLVLTGPGDTQWLAGRLRDFRLDL
ncbi:MAG: hypothetical protein FJW85_01345 [Actinobacteria bacterium]|nr:hypothetical protein [Actinomycetota bacterium]